MEAFAHDCRHAIRALTHRRGVALVAIVTLALGIGATTTMFGVVDAALLRPVPFVEPDRLVILYVTRTTPREGLVKLRWSRAVIGALEDATVGRATDVGRVLSDQALRRVQKDPPYMSSFETIASFTRASISVSGGDSGPEQIDGEIISPGYFRALHVSPAAGRAFLAGDDAAAGTPAIALISDRLWHQRFASDRAAVGATIRINDVPLTIVGILPPGFAGISGKADVWMPRTMAPRVTYSEYLTTPQLFISVVARLRDGVPLAQANAELAALGRRVAGVPSVPDATWSAMAVPIGEARVDAAMRRSVLLLLAAAVCVLVIACVNVASLLLARARTRRREFAVRLALGASRTRLVRMLLTEGLLIAILAGVCGTVLAAWGVALFARTAPGIIASFGNSYGAVASFAAPALDVRVLLFALAATLGTTMAFALVPALAASRQDLVPALKEDDRGSSRHRTLAGLVVCEVALAVLLLASAGLLIENFSRMQNLRTGFSTDRVITFWVRPPAAREAAPDGPAIVERLLTRIEQVPGVETAAVNRCTPFYGCARTTIFFPDKPFDRTNAPAVGRHYISADYFRTLGIPVLAGRALTASDRRGQPPVAVVNETGARRFWPGENPIGKRLWFGPSTGPVFNDPARPLEIVGVVGDVKYEAVDQPINADFYTSYLQFTYPDTMVIVKARGSASALVPALRTAVATVDASTPIFDVMTLDERIASATARPRFNATVVAAFSAAALLLAAIGVYGVLSYAVSSRTRELGIRLALGADGRRLLTLVLGEGLRLATIGAVLGIAAALAVARVMQGLLVGVTASDPRVLAAGVAVMLVVSALAAFLPARRAAAIDPIVVLRDQ
ncbi:MAG: ABC transporter permease [Acidobacteria bacterium]|nr:ABC transporter permease [Acidobacteriota bacterium]